MFLTRYCLRSLYFSVWSLLLLFLYTPGIAQVKIDGFAPATVCQGDKIVITGSGLDNVKTITLGGLAITDFQILASNSIQATVPLNATDGKVVVKDATSSDTSHLVLQVLPAPQPVLTDIGATDAPFTNCNSTNQAYTLKVSNGSVVNGINNQYSLDWGDGSALFTTTDWTSGANLTHTYATEGYFQLSLTIKPANGCTRTTVYQVYNGRNPLASFTTTNATTGLCTPAAVEFQIGNWAHNSPGTRYELDFGDGSPLMVLQHPLNTTGSTYLISHSYTRTSCPSPDFKATLRAINGCYTTTYTLDQIIIRTRPAANFSVNQVNCINAPVCFTNTTTNGYSGNSCNQATVFNWDFGDGTSSTDAQPGCHTYTKAATYHVVLSASNTACGTDVIAKDIVVQPISPPPTAPSPITYCQYATATALTATGTNLHWYGGNNPPAAPVPDTHYPGTYTFWVTQQLPNQCESPQTPVTVIINAKPPAPAVRSPLQLCFQQPASPLTATGSNLLWYTASTGGTGSGTAPTPATTAVGSTTYYVSQTVNGCESDRAPIVVNVVPLAIPPTVTTPVKYCQFATAQPLNALGNNLLWYTSATGGTGSAVPITPSTLVAGTFKYYVSQTSSCGESQRAEIDVQISPMPSATISYPPLCNSAPTPAAPNPPVPVTLTGTSGGSFSIQPASGLPLDPVTGTVTPAGATPGTYTIWYTVAATPLCASFTTTTQVTVSTVPQATISYPGLCSADAAVAPVITGDNYGTFSAPAGLSIDKTTGVINPGASTPGAYKVTYTIAPAAPCPGFQASVDITVTKALAATISYTPNVLCNTVNSAATPNPPVNVVHTGATGGTYTVLPAGLTINAATGQINPSGANAGVYTVTYTLPVNGGCGQRSVTTTVTINDQPSASISYPPVCASSGPVPVNRSGTPGGVFTSTAGLSIDKNTGTITPAGSTPGTYTVFYEIAASAPCAGFKTSANVTISVAAQAAIRYPANVYCNNVTAANPPVAVIQTGTKGGTYSIVPAGLNIDAATGTVTPAGAVPNVYTVYYTIPGTGGCGDATATASITINATPQASISYPGSPYCAGLGTSQPVTLNGTTGGTFSAGTGLAINAATGAINPAASTPGNYTVTYAIAAAAPCPGFSTQVNVTIAPKPVISFTPTQQTVCSGTPASFKPTSSVSNTTYTWSVNGGLPNGVTGLTSGGFSDPGTMDLVFTNTTSQPQTLHISVQPVNPASNPCPGDAVTVTLIINPITPAPATTHNDLCMGTAPQTLHFTPLAGSTVKWYDAAGNALPQAPVIPTMQAGNFTYYATQTDRYGCESPKAAMTASVHLTPRIVQSVVQDPSTCGVASGSVTLTVQDLDGRPLPGMPFILHYTSVQDPLVANVTSNANAQINIPLKAGTYTDFYVETADGCASAPLTDLLELKDPTPPARPVAGYNPPLCSGQDLVLTALSPGGQQPGAIQYVWAGAAFGSKPDTSTNTSVVFHNAQPYFNGTYAVYATQNGCVSGATIFTVTVTPGPTAPAINTNAPLCTGQDLMLQAYSTIASGETLQYQWTGPNNTFPANTSNIQVTKATVDNSGIYKVTVTSPGSGCSVSADTLVQIGVPPIVMFPQDTIVLPAGYKLQLQPVITNATAPGALPIRSFAWTPADVLSCDDAVCSTAFTTVKKDACYQVLVTNVYGCKGSAEVCVRAFCQSVQVFIPNAFAPNGNVPENRKLMVRGTGIASIKSFRVFNRWGRIMFERSNINANDAASGWDGRVDGRMADTGVYVYTVEVICENGTLYTYKGNVTLF